MAPHAIRVTRALPPTPPVRCVAQYEHRNWQLPGYDPSDYFNYGLREDTWRLYAKRQQRFGEELKQVRWRVKAGRAELCLLELLLLLGVQMLAAHAEELEAAKAAAAEAAARKAAEEAEARRAAQEAADEKRREALAAAEQVRRFATRDRDTPSATLCTPPHTRCAGAEAPRGDPAKKGGVRCSCGPGCVRGRSCGGRRCACLPPCCCQGGAAQRSLWRCRARGG